MMASDMSLASLDRGSRRFSYPDAEESDSSGLGSHSVSEDSVDVRVTQVASKKFDRSSSVSHEKRKRRLTFQHSKVKKANTNNSDEKGMVFVVLTDEEKSTNQEREEPRSPFRPWNGSIEDDQDSKHQKSSRLSTPLPIESPTALDFRIGHKIDTPTFVPIDVPPRVPSLDSDRSSLPDLQSNSFHHRNWTKTEPDPRPRVKESMQDHRNQRHYKIMTRERRIEANARERTRVHTISAAFDTLRRTIPAYSYNQKLSKLSVLRIACRYIMTLGVILDESSSTEKFDVNRVGACVNLVSRTIRSEGKIRNKK